MFISVLLSIFLNFPTVEKNENPPNILWIVIEDMSPQFFSPYGNMSVKMPTIDSLFEEGTRFDAAFSTGAVCSPSRYTIITGTRTNEYGTGHHRSAYPIPDNILPFPYYLKKQGYHTSNNYKKDYNTSAINRLSAQAWTESSDEAGWWNREEGQPFFSVFNFNNSHQSRTFTNPYSDYKARILNKLKVEEIVEDSAIIIPEFYHDTPELRKELARTYNCLKKTDNEINDLLERLKKDKLLSSTIIFIYSDHGGGALRTKSHGLALGHQVPLAVIVPEKYKNLNPFQGVKSTNQCVTFEDFGPTVLSLAGLTKPGYMTGKPFLGISNKPQKYVFSSVDRSGESMNLTRSVTDGRFFYTKIFYPNKPAYSYQKYFDYSKSRILIRRYNKEGRLNKTQSDLFLERPHELLYDLNKDKWQVNNLVNNPEYSIILDKLRIKLDHHLISIKDAHFIPEYLLDSLSQLGPVYNFIKSKEYNFESIYNVANLIGSKKNEQIEIIKAMKSDDPILRYWGTLVLSSLSKDIQRSNLNIISERLDDNFGPVQIISASLLYQLTSSEDSRNIIKKFIHHSNPYLSNQMIQEIIYFDKEKAIHFVDDINELKDTNKNGLLSESIDMYNYLFNNQSLYYQYHW